MKKLFAALLSLLLIILPLGVGAEQPQKIYSKGSLMHTVRLCGDSEEEYPYFYEIDCSHDTSDENKAKIIKDIYDAISNMDDRVDLSEYELPVHMGISRNGYIEPFSIGIDLLNEVNYYYPELYYIENFVPSYYLDANGEPECLGELIFYSPEHIPEFAYKDEEGNVIYPLDLKDYTKEAQAKKLAFCNSEIKKIIAGIPKGSTDDIQKVVYVHDYIVTNYEYDIYEEIFDTYNFLKYKKGVCQAYTHTFKMIMDKLGIECHAAMSNVGNHIWNVVKINNKYYYVDCTGDDPVMILGYSDSGAPIIAAAGMYGYVPHTDLLVSAEKLEEIDGIDSYQHYMPINLPSIMTYQCNNTDYDNAALKNFTSTVIPYENEWYGVTCDMPRKVVKFHSDFTSFDKEHYDVIPSKQYFETDDDGNVIRDKTLTYWETICAVIGSDIYINDPFTVIKYNLKTKICETVYESTADSEDDTPCLITGCYVAPNGMVGIILRDASYKGFDNLFPDYENTNNCYCAGVQIGDLTNDGKIMADDLLIMKDYLLTGQSSIVNFGGLADLTQNNTVDLLDFVKMKQVIAEQV